MKRNFIRDRIYYFRTTNKYSARNLSLELGMSSEYINQIETGRLNPSLDFIVNFCEFFNISLSVFFDENLTYPIEYCEIINNLKQLSKKDVDLIFELSKALKK